MKTKTLLTFALSLLISVSFSQSDPFEGRSTSVSSDIASPKENVPAKKESFSSKLDRYKSDGFKVAVVLYSGDISTKLPNPSGSTSASSQLSLEEGLPSIKEDLTPLVTGFTATMNETFGTDVFEVVDLSKIPYKESKWGNVDDWGATKYKMVVTYSANPEFDYSLSGGKYTAQLNVILNVVATEFVDEKGKVKMKYPIRAGNLGSYNSPQWKSENDPGFKTVSQLQSVVNAPMGADLLVELQKAQDEKMDEFIEKRKK